MINVSAAGGVGLVELDRPQRRNALDVEHCHRLADGVERLVADTPPAARPGRRRRVMAPDQRQFVDRNPG